MAASCPTGARSSAGPGDARGDRRPAADRAAVDGRATRAGSKACWSAAWSAPTSSATQTLQGKVLAGSLEALRPGDGNVAIGARLAEALGANVGGQISLISPDGRTTPFGTVPRIVSYNVAAIFEVGVYDYDKSFVIMPIEDAQTPAADGRCGRNGRGADGRRRPGRRDPRAASRRASAAAPWSPTGAR